MTQRVERRAEAANVAGVAVVLQRDAHAQQRAVGLRQLGVETERLAPLPEAELDEDAAQRAAPGRIRIWG